MAIHNLDIKVTNGVTNAVLPTPQSVEVLDLANSVLASGSSLDGNVTIPLDNPPATLKLRLNSNLNIEQEFDWNDADLIVDFILTRVFYRVKATSSYIDSPWSNIAELNLQADQPPIPTLLPLTEEDILVMVAPAVYPQEVHYSVDNGVTYSLLATLPVGTDSYIADGLIGGKVYYFKTRTLSIIPSEYSDTTNAQTLYDFGLALNFESVTGNHVDLGAQLDAVPISENLTFGFWFNLKGQEVEFHNVFKNYDSVIASVSLGIVINLPENISGKPPSTGPVAGMNVITFFISFAAGSDNKQYFEVTVPKDSDWHFYAITRELVNNNDQHQYSVYVDAVLLRETEGNANVPQTIYGDITRIGSADFGAAFEGMLDNFSITNSFYTASEILAIYNEGKSSRILLDDPNSLLFHDFNTPTAEGGEDNTGLTTITDQSGNGRDGTLTGFTLDGPDSNYVDSVPFEEIAVLTATAISTCDIELSWVYPAGVPVVASAIEYDTDPNFGSPTPLTNSPPGQNWAIASGLAVATKYYFRIRLVDMTGWFKVESSYPLTDPLSLFGPDLHAWYSGDSYQGLSTDITQVDDQSGNGRHLIEGANGQWDILIDSDGNPNLNIAAVGARLHNNTNWNGLGTGDFFVIQRMSSTIGTTFRVLWGADVGSTGSANAQNFNVSGGSIKTIGWRNTNTDYWYVEQGTPNGSVQMFTAKAGTNRLWNNGSELVMTDASIVAKSNSFDNLSVGQLSDGLTEPTLIAFNDLIFIKGSPEDYPDLVNALHDDYLKNRYPSLNIQNPNL